MNDEEGSALKMGAATVLSREKGSQFSEGGGQRICLQIYI
jgi:hypothetical protein